MQITLLKAGQTIDSLNESINEKNIVLDFYADWCGPCKTLTRTLNSLTLDENLKNIHVIKVDVEKHSNIAQRYQVKAMPTLVFLKNGKQVHTKVGAPTEASFKALIEEVYE